MSKFSIWVDADSCPALVRDLIIRFCKRLSLNCFYVANRQIGIPKAENFKMIITDSTKDAADNMLHELSHLPVVVDPSHSGGMARLVKPLSLSAAAAGADGLMIEVHNDPPHALCDGAQSLTPEQFADVAKRVNKILEVTD